MKPHRLRGPLPQSPEAQAAATADVRAVKDRVERELLALLALMPRVLCRTESPACAVAVCGYGWR